MQKYQTQFSHEKAQQLRKLKIRTIKAKEAATTASVCLAIAFNVAPT